MSEEMLVCHCSPTLAGLKTGSLFSCPYSSQKMIIKEIREFNQKLTQKGIRIIPVRISDKRMLVYVYRPEKLKEDFSDEKTQIILKCKGYDCTNPSQCICRLIQKLQSDPDFPHEIGLFLGYPAEDVKGFIENRAEGYKCSGCWKVYGNEQEAKCRFERFRRCTSIYCSQWSRGKSIECLTVAAGS